MDYTAKDILDTANSFEAASQAVVEKLKQTNDIGMYIAPFITLSSFAIELFLKCIYMIENGKPAPFTHGLAELFALLSEESRVVVTMIYDLSAQQDPVVKTLLEKVPDTKLDLVSVLQETSEAFKKWRYSYQKKFTGFPTSGPLIHALRARIKILEPDWM